jgi:hypothetical protein
MGSPAPSVLLLLALAGAGCAGIPGRGGDAVRAAPAYERERPVPSAPRITDVLLPFGHAEESPGLRSTAVRPLYRHLATDAGTRTEVLYPLYRTQESRGVVATRLLPFYWHDELPNAAGIDSDTAVMPILFWGSDPEEGAYFCLFPVGGVVKQKFLADRTTFVLFPLYAGTRTGKWRGHHVLWPVIHWGSDGERRSALRIFPFYMEHLKEGSYARRSALWPLVHWSAEDLDRAHPRRGWLVWPFYGQERSDDGQSEHTLLWPFFSWADGPRLHARDLPYPFYRTRKEWEAGPDGKPVLLAELFWLWPFYGRYDRGDEERTRFYAWPLVFTWDVEAGALREKAVAVMPFWRRVVHERPDGGFVDAWWKFWPLAQGGGRADGSGGWSALAPIPWFRWEEFEANWGIFWEIARVRRDADGSRSTDLLFSLIRERVGPGGEEHRRVPLLMRADRDGTGQSWSILEGLLGGETAPDGASSLRLLWFLRIPLSSGGGRR